jgi:hypothetical protein
MRDDRRMRGCVSILGLATVGCSGSSTAPGQADTAVDADAPAGEADRAVEATSDLDAVGDQAEVAGDSLPAYCNGLGSVNLSAPAIRSGVAAPGQSAVVSLTMTDLDPNGFISYVGAVIASATNGVSIMYPEVAPAGASIDSTASKTVEFTAKFDPTISSGTQASFSARVFGWGHSAPDCSNAFVLEFSLPVQ